MATIQGVYVALFGRPADPTGLAYFNSVTKNGADLSGIGDLASTQEYKDRFAGQSNVQIVNSIFQSLFGRDADAAGLAFFVNALNNGTQNIKTIAINILDGAQGSDKTTVNNKIAAADLYTSHLDTGSEIVAYSGNAAAAQGRTFLSGVTSTVPTAAAVDTAIAAMVTASNGGGTGTDGVTLTLQTGAAVADFIAPDQANTASKTTAGNDTIRGIAAGDLNSVDSIDGGAGTDTLNAQALLTGTIKPVLKSIENVNLTYGTLTGAVTFDAGDSSGIQKLSVASVKTAAGALSATVAGIDASTTVSIKNFDADVANSTAVITYKNVSGSSDAATVSLEKVAGANVGTFVLDAAGIEKLTVNSGGAVAADTNTVKVKDAAIQTLTLTGDHNITVTNDAGNTSLKTVDASALTGTLTYTATGNGETITGTAKADGITLGLGNDTVVYTANNKSTLGNLDSITSFNALNADKLDVKALALGATTTVGTSTINPAADYTDFFKQTGVATDKILKMAVGADVMVFVDANGDGNFNAGTDLTIKLVGLAASIGDIDKADFILS